MQPGEPGTGRQIKGRIGPLCGVTTWSYLPPSAPNRSSSSHALWRASRRQVAADAVAELDIRGLLEELVREGVDVLIIGGVAVGYHGHVRATKDVDVVPDPDPANLKRLARVLGRLEAEIEGADEFDAGELPDPLDPKALADGGNWVLATRLGRLDIMQWIGEQGLWERLSPAAVEDEIGDLPIKMVSYEDLVALKELAGRPEDLLDLERLRMARRP